MLRVRLLGDMQVELEGAIVASQASQRPWALMAYLAAAPGTVARSELATRFWPDVLDASARASLRSALWALRRELGDRVVVEGDRVGLSADADVWVDVREFERLVEDTELEAALDLCRGDLLEGIDDEWALLARERHRERVIELLERLAQRAERSGDTQAAIAWTRRQVERDPLDEGASQRLIGRFAAAGDRAAALRVYRSLTERLRRELGVAASARTRELVEELRAEAPVVTAEPAVAPSPGALPLVGRDAEFAQLVRAWDVSAKGAGGVTLLRGEAGIGKTRLAGEMRERAVARGALSASCAALDLGGAAPLSLWAELLRELLPLLPAPPPEAAWPDDLTVLISELPAQFGRAGTVAPLVALDLQRTRLFEAVVALIAWATRDRPLLLVFDDVHTADGPSLELAAYAARRVAGLPVMMLLTRRELPRSGDADRLEGALRGRGLLACELTLGPLDRAGVEALARSAARLEDAAVERVVEQAEGNALLAVESARAVGRGEEQVAATLRGSVRAALAPLAADARELVEVAAVAGRAIEPAELEELALPQMEPSAAAALEAGLLTSTAGRLGFRHALLRDAVYAEIADPRRRALHQRWAEALMAGEVAGGQSRPAEAARHLRLGGRDRDAVAQLVRAAADARAVAALDAAADYLEEALSITPERTDLLLELGEIEAWRALRDKAEPAFARALELLADGEPIDLARAHLRRARAYHGPICVPSAVLESSRAALELLDSTAAPADPERHEALAACAWAEAVAGSADEAERLLAELGREPPASDLETYGAAHGRALALMRRGRFTEAYAPSIAAGEAIARAGLPDQAYGCWANAAGAATAAGELDRALEFVDRGAAALAGKGLLSLEAHLLGARSFILIRDGRLDDARAATEAERKIADQVGQPELIAMASHDRGLVELEAGRYEDAAALLAGALVEGAPISRPLTRLALAEAHSRSGQLEAAAAELRATVLEPARPSDFPAALVPRLARVQGLIALAHGDREEATRRLNESIAGWERLAASTTVAQSVTTVLADIGRPVVGLVEPARELARARADLESLQPPTEEGMPNALVQ